MRLSNLASVAASCFAVVQAAPAASGPASPTITASNGVVVGYATTVVSLPSSTATVYNYLGIPFAAAPTGTRRFRAPSATSWTEPVRATNLPPSCLQQFNKPDYEAALTEKFFNNPGGPAPAESEDCLFLNVFTPTDASPQKKKPVLFWIFGGNLQFGTGSLSYYNGSSFAGFQDVIVVTHNYRTNVFGFSNSPELEKGTQNAGFLDQRMALKWVHENIAAFGGDPDKVTIFGQSAGGYSVKQLLAHPPDPLPYSSAIMLSEATLFSGQAQLSYPETIQYFGCAKEASPLACLQKVPATDLQDYIEEQGLGFAPVDDDVIMSKDVRSSITSGKFAKVPIMMGTTADEATVLVASLGLDGGSGTVEDMLEHVLPNASVITPAIIDTYVAVQKVAFLAASAIVTDLIFTCQTAQLSNVLADNGYDVWRYYYNATFADEDSFRNAGAYHSSEIPQVFGTYPISNVYGSATEDQVGLSSYMQTTWANFAKDADAGPGWDILKSIHLLGNTLGGKSKQPLQDVGGIDPKGGKQITAGDTDGSCLLLDPIVTEMGI